MNKSTKAKLTFGQHVTLIGAKLGVPCKDAMRLQQSSNDLQMALFGSDAQVVNYYQSYDSAVNSAQSNTAQVYSFVENEANQKKNDALTKKQVKAAERQAKAESVSSVTNSDECKSGNYKDVFVL